MRTHGSLMVGNPRCGHIPVLSMLVINGLQYTFCMSPRAVQLECTLTRPKDALKISRIGLVISYPHSCDNVDEETLLKLYI